MTTDKNKTANVLHVMDADGYGFTVFHPEHIFMDWREPASDPDAPTCSRCGKPIDAEPDAMVDAMRRDADAYLPAYICAECAGADGSQPDAAATARSKAWHESQVLDYGMAD